MSLKDFIRHVVVELNELSQSKKVMLESAPVLTNLSFFRGENSDQPGFLTSWWEQTSTGNNMGVIEAGQELIMKTAANLILVGGNLLGVVCTPFTGGEGFEHSTTERWLGASIGVFQYSASFVIDIVLCLAAMVTRTLGSIIALGVGIVSELIDNSSDSTLTM